MKEKRKCLLLLSPIEIPTHPYASVPQLVTWLRRKGQPADALDLNIEFFWWLIEKNEEKEFFSSAWEELKALNAKGKLDTGEIWRFASLYRIFQLLDYLSLTPDKSFFGDKNRRSLYLLIANMFPVAAIPLKSEIGRARETASYEYISIRYGTDCNCYSSASLAAAIETPTLMDDFFQEFLAEHIAKNDYLFVGISVPFYSQCEPALRIARAVKKVRPGLHVCLGGNFVGLHLSHAENPEIFKYVDSLSVGDGEIPVLEFCAELESGSPDLRKVSGLVFPENGTIRRNPLKPPLPLEEIPVPDEIFDRKRYLNPTGDYLTRVRLSAGCSWGRCAFCNISGCGLYPRRELEEKKMIEKIKELVARGEQRVYFGDDESDLAALERFARLVLEEGLVFRWSTNVRFSDRMTLEWALLMRQSGCSSLTIGIESYHDRLLRHIRKGTSVALIDRCLEDLAWAGVPVTAYMMVGLPTETEEEARISFERLLQKVRQGYIKSVLYSLYSVSRDSPIDRNPGEYGVTLPELDPGLDLRPGFTFFEHSGMSQAKAMALHNEFTEKISEAIGNMDFDGSPDQARTTVNGMFISAANAKDLGRVCWKGDFIIPRKGSEQISQKAYDAVTPSKFFVRSGKKAGLDSKE